MVFHNQSDDISSELAGLAEALDKMGVGGDYTIHAGPLIRREEDYATAIASKRRTPR